jgi:type IV pilus assembly protein PilE
MFKHKGFTLIELMISVAIIGILASIAYPSYVDYVAKGVRADGLAILVEVANIEEQFYLDNRTYSNDMTELGFKTNPFKTENEDYSVSVTTVGTGTYTIKATAIGGQATRDSACSVIQITETGAKTPKACW